MIQHATKYVDADVFYYRLIQNTHEIVELKGRLSYIEGAITGRVYISSERRRKDINSSYKVTTEEGDIYSNGIWLSKPNRYHVIRTFKENCIKEIKECEKKANSFRVLLDDIHFEKKGAEHGDQRTLENAA